MPQTIAELLAANRVWSKRVVQDDPDFFNRLLAQQTPQFLWIGCSDSRVPSNHIIGAEPGEVFVHRNIANMVNHSDLNLLSVLQYAVEVLRVKHVIVCGHFACGGVRASLEGVDHGLIDNWIRPIKQIYEDHIEEFEGLSHDQIVDKLCEWNVRQQVINVGRTTVMQKAWKKAQKVSVHGLIYDLADGRLVDLGVTLSSASDMPRIYHLS